jgi:hypothetical protein
LEALASAAVVPAAVVQAAVVPADWAESLDTSRQGRSPLSSAADPGEGAQVAGDRPGDRPGDSAPLEEPAGEPAEGDAFVTSASTDVDCATESEGDWGGD